MTKRKTDPTNGPKLGADRRLPRHPSEIGLLPQEAQEWIADLRERAIVDLGGDDNVSALRKRVLVLGNVLESVGLMLMHEVSEKAKRARSRGSVPNPSRYRATPLMKTFLEGAARLYSTVGLTEHAKTVTLDGYLRDRAKAESAPESDVPDNSKGSAVVNGERAAQVNRSAKTVRSTAADAAHGSRP